LSKVRVRKNLFSEKGAFLFKNLPIASYAWQIIEEDLILIEYNDAAYKITDGNIENYIGIKATELYSDQPEILEDLRKCAKEKMNFFKEYKYKFKSVDLEKYFSANFGFIPPDIVIVHTNDITEKKEAELKKEEISLKLKESERNLKKLNKELERIIAEKTKKLRESEERYHRILENANDMIYVLNQNYELEYINENAFMIQMGYQSEELIGKSPLGLIYSEDIEKVRKGLRNGFENGQGTIELRIRDKKGNYHWLEVRGKTFQDTDGKTKALSIARDINERKLTEQHLKESEEKFRTLAEQSFLGIAIVQDNLVKYLNKKLANLFGYSVDEVITWPVGQFLNVIHPEDREFVAKQVMKKQYGDIDAINQYQFRGIKENGDMICLEVFSKTINYQGKTADFVTILDISERKLAEKKLKKSEEKYREAYDRANFYKDLFAHDINNIMQVINSSAELILYYLNSFEKTQEIGTITEMIIKQIKRAKLLVHNVNTLTELEEGIKPIKIIEAYKLLQNSVNYVRTAYQERAIDISVESFSDRILVHANKLLQEVFDNILTNAVKYNNKSIIEILVYVSKERKGNNNYFKFEFIDNGIGIHDARKEIIFKRGHREFKDQKGMGLGLSLVKKILAGFNGEIWVEDKIQYDYTKGSKFVILLPEAP
jgi:PAS domain S-box-containing protein